MSASLFLGSLPAEVLQEIGPHLCTRDIASIRLASSRFSQVFAPFLTSRLHMYIDCCKAIITTRRQRPSSLFIPDTLVPYIKSITIHIDCGHNSEHFDSLMNRVTEVIAMFKLIREITINSIGSGDPTTMMVLEHQILSVSMECHLATLDSIGILNSYIFTQETISLPLPKPLSMFKELRFAQDDDPGFISRVHRILSQSSVLEILQISCSAEFESSITIHNLIPSKSTNPHFPLHNLSLVGPVEWSPVSPQLPSFTHLRRLSIIDNEGLSSLDSFWDCLRTTNVRLECLHLCHTIVPGLPRYLTSYNGLQEFAFLAIDVFTQEESNSVTRAIQCHAPTLTNLTMKWAFRDYTSGEDGKPSTLSLFSPALYSNLTCLDLECPVEVEWFRSPTFAQDMLEWLEGFPALNQAYILWEPNGNPPPTISVDNITNQLVGRSGRLQYWVWHISWDGWRSSDSDIILGIQRHPEGGWRFVGIPPDPYFEMNWWYSP